MIIGIEELLLGERSSVRPTTLREARVEQLREYFNLRDQKFTPGDLVTPRKGVSVTKDFIGEPHIVIHTREFSAERDYGADTVLIATVDAESEVKVMWVAPSQLERYDEVANLGK